MARPRFDQNAPFDRFQTLVSVRAGRRGEATVKRYHYDTHDQPKARLAAFLDAYNFAKRLKTDPLRSHLPSLGRRA